MTVSPYVPIFMHLTRRRLFTTLLAAPLTALTGRAADEEQLLPGPQLERLKKFIPRTLAKMQRRDPVFVAVCGDECSAFYQPGRGIVRKDIVRAWYGRFLDRLGAPFFYHGGVVDTTPVSAQRDAALEEAWATWRKLRAEWEKTGKGDPPPVPGLPVPDPSGPEDTTGVNQLQRLSQPSDALIPSPSSFYADNFAEEGAVGVQVFDPVLSMVFNAEEKAAADLVIIAYGARDALLKASLATFRAALEAAVAECRSRGADVILAGPPPALDEADERAATGRSRPWAAVMREVADAAGVFFADLGAAAVYQPSDLINRTVEGNFRAAIDPVRRLFDHGEKVQDAFHPSGPGHVRMGETAADWLLRGEPVRPFAASGELVIGGGPAGEDVLTIRVACTAPDPVTIGVSPLRFAGWSIKPGSPDRVHTFQPGRGARLFRYVAIRNAEPLQGHEEFIRGSALISDDDAQHLVDIKVLVQPVMLLWPEERVDGAAGEHLLKCTLVNTGTVGAEVALTLDWLGKATALPAVKIPPGERLPVPLRLPLPAIDDAALRFRNTVTVDATVNGRTARFTRHVEGVRHLGLTQKVPLVPLRQWRALPAPGETIAPGPQLKIQADPKAVYFQIDIPADIAADVVEGKPWGRLEVQIDGRKTGENGKLGAVGTLVIEIPHEEGACRLLPVKPAVFGNGYAYPYDPRGFRAVVRVKPDGSRTVEFSMVRVFLKHHEWSLDGGGQADLGINVRLALWDAVTGGPGEARTFTLTASKFPSADARSLTLLELRSQPAPRWSMRIG